MKSRIYLALMAGALLAVASACSEDVSNSPVQYDKGNAIRFAAQSPALSRAVTTTSNLDQFSVYAYTLGKPFMENVTVTKSPSNVWTYSPTQYWPASAVNFYAFAPASWSSTGTPADPTAPVDYYSEYGNTDLVYSVLMNQTQSGSPVIFNFRHALAQVNVALRTDSASKLDIRVSNVVLHGVDTKGSFTFPSESTLAGTQVKGTWSNVSNPGTYILYMASTPESRLQLTSTAQIMNEVSQGLVLPQTLTNLEDGPDNVQGEYIQLDLVIYDKATGNQLWPNTQTPPSMNITNGYEKTGRLYFPVITQNVPAWESGTRYVYTITINEPAGLNEIQFGAPTVDVYNEVGVDLK